MKNKRFSLLFLVTIVIILLSISCGNGNGSSKKSTDTTAKSTDTIPANVAMAKKKIDPVTTPIIFGNPATGNCSGKGICQAGLATPSGGLNPINVTFNFIQGIAPNPSQVTMSFDYYQLYQNQIYQNHTHSATNFYDGTTANPLPYQFDANYAISNIFPGTPGTISTGNITLTFNPVPQPGNLPAPGTIVAGQEQVLVTFTVGP